MAPLTAVQSSNSRIASALSPRLVAVFVSAISGIGEASLKQFAKHARQPRAYFIGRSKDAGDRITAECKALNPEGEYVFIQADVSLIRVVDDVCEEIEAKEKTINILFLTAGTLNGRTALRHVVVVFAAGKEGPIDKSDFQALRVPFLSIRGQLCSLITLGHEAVAKEAPSVSFIRNFPGAVMTSLLDDMKGVLAVGLRLVFGIVGPWICMPIEECGERHLFLATSTKYSPASVQGDNGSGVPLADGMAIAKGTDGELGSGVYSVGEDGESTGPKVEKLLAKFRNEGMVEQVWQHTEEEFKRITGKEAI